MTPRRETERAADASDESRAPAPAAPHDVADWHPEPEPPPAEAVETAAAAEPAGTAEPAEAAEAAAPRDATESRVADLVERARAQESAGILAGALAAYRELTDLQPRAVRWRRELARVLEQQGQADAAVLELDRALEQQPDDVPLLCARAALLTGLLRYERAEADLRRAVKLQEHNVDVLIGLGALACKRGRWRDGLEPLRRAADLSTTASTSCRRRCRRTSARPSWTRPTGAP
jgi:tetratricopeptide (TPR) repeat protein